MLNKQKHKRKTRKQRGKHDHATGSGTGKVSDPSSQIWWRRKKKSGEKRLRVGKADYAAGYDGSRKYAGLRKYSQVGTQSCLRRVHVIETVPVLQENLSDRTCC